MPPPPGAPAIATRDTSPIPLSGDAALAGLDLFAYAEQRRCSVAAPRPQNPCTTHAEPPPEALRLRDVLSTHLSRARAITAPAIAEAAGLWPDLSPADRGTRAREIITTWYESLQLAGRVLVSDSCGFWHSDDPAEISRYHRSLLSRIREIGSRARRVRLAAQTTGRFAYHGGGHWAREEATHSL